MLGKLRRSNVFGTRTLRATSFFKLDFLTLAKFLHRSSYDGGVVKENLSRIGSDESKTFFCD
jgi:hypothetical protein